MKKLLLSLLSLASLQPVIAMNESENTLFEDCSCEDSDEWGSSDSFEMDLFKDNERSRTPLMNAAFTSNYEECKKLLMAGADINKQTTFSRGTALNCAAQEGHIQIVKLLLTHGANPALKQRGEKKSKGSDMVGDIISAAHLARENNHLEVVEVIKSHKNMLRTFFEACQNGDMATCASFLTKYRIANVRQKKDSRDRMLTPLTIAAMNGHYDLCQLLLYFGANSIGDKESNHSAILESLFIPSPKNAAQQYAEARGHTAIAELLKNHTRTPLPLKQLCLYEIVDMLEANALTNTEVDALPDECFEFTFVRTGQEPESNEGS